MENRDMVKWWCPECDSINFDFVEDYTCCGICGEVVYVLNEENSVNDQHYKVDIELIK